MAYYFMTFYQIVWFSSIFLLHGLVIFRQQKIAFLLISWSSKNGNYTFQSLNYLDINKKPRFLIKSGYYILPSSYTALLVLLLLHSYCIFDAASWMQFETQFIFYSLPKPRRNKIGILFSKFVLSFFEKKMF